MLLALVSVLFVGITASAPIGGKGYHGFVPSPPGRGTIDIFWSCVSTLIICLWTSLHPNIPTNNISFVTLVKKLWDMFVSSLSPKRGDVDNRDPVKRGNIQTIHSLPPMWMMFLSAMAPEAMTARAIDTYIHVKHQLQIINSLPQMSHRADNLKWTMTDCFYVKMGGFVVVMPGRPAGATIDTNQFISLVEQKYIDIPPSGYEGIMDRSKASSLAKSLVLLQTLWLLAQCLARSTQHLPLTILELTTVGYVFFASITYACYWNKPLNVRTTTTITLSIPTIIPTIPPTENSNPATPLLADEKASNVISPNEEMNSFLKKLPPPTIKDDQPFRQYGFWVFLVATSMMFGLWHCLAWNFHFPTHVERLAWRICALITAAAIPFTIVVGVLPMVVFKHLDVDVDGMAKVVFGIIGMIYTIARLLMMIEIFADLRSLPARAFETTQWTKFIPHF